MGKGSSPNIPNPPNVARSYTQGIQAYLGSLPQLEAAEMSSRQTYDPQMIAQQQQMQSQFGPTQYAQQLQALNQLDPQWMANHQQLGSAIDSQLAQGSHLTADQSDQISQQVRGAQAARGNAYGDSAGVSEAYTLGSAGLQLQQQRMQNALAYSQSPSVGMQLGYVSPVTAPTSPQFVDPNAGWQGVNAANSAYQGQVGAAAANGSGGSSWGGALSAVGSIIGGAMMMFSDKRIKKNISKIGTGPNGVNLYKFAMRGQSPNQQHVGVIAQDVEKKVPGAVSTDPNTGLKAVDYMRAVGMPGPIPIRS